MTMPGTSELRHFTCDQCGAQVACYSVGEEAMAREHHRCPIPGEGTVIAHVIRNWQWDHDRPACQVCSSPNGRRLLDFIDALIVGGLPS